MKSKVHFSLYCVIVTVVTLGALATGIVVTYSNPNTCITISAITTLLVLSGVCFCPVSVCTDSNGITIRRLLLGRKVFEYSDIHSVETCYPSAGGLRLFGSSGFFGYWGYFSDILIGKYFGYYADRSQCFCIKLKNNHQYVVSCAKHAEMVENIQKYLK